MTRFSFPAPWRRAGLGLLAAGALLLAGCTTPITAKVTSFNAWPADAAGATFGYVAHGNQPEGLEQATYEGYVRNELVRAGLKPATSSAPPRFLVDVTAAGTERQKKVLVPIYQDQMVFVPPRRDVYGRVFPGYWVPDQFGTRWIGDREVTRTVQVSRLKILITDNEKGSPGKPQAVFDTTAVYEGMNEDLPDLVPYLVRAAFDRFPGTNGVVRLVKFDAKTGAIETAPR